MPAMRCVTDLTYDQRLRCAALVKEMIDWPQFADKPWVRVALAIASRAIERGRHLTDAEKAENLRQAMEDDLKTPLA